MKYFDQIIKWIEKNNLTEEETNSLHKILKEDAEAAEFYNSYKKLGTAFLASKHLTTDEFADYVLIKNGMEPETTENLSKIPLFDAHIRICEKCTEELKFYNKEYLDVDNFISTQFEAGKAEHQKSAESKPFPLPKSFFSKYVVIGISAMVIVLFTLILISDLSTSKYYKLASVNESSDISISRGRTTDDYELSMKALEEKDYPSAIKFLKNDIESSPNDETIFYSYYILGLIYLETAEKNVVGLFPKFDKSAAESSLKYFKKTNELNTSGKFQNVNLDAHFYSAKACLMLDDLKSAKEYLNIVINEKGSKIKDATRILNEIE